MAYHVYMEVTCPGPYLQDRELESSGCEQTGVGVGGGGESMGRTGPHTLEGALSDFANGLLQGKSLGLKRTITKFPPEDENTGTGTKHRWKPR